ncbi:hypothetical protein IWX64_002681 [Arthrobacter sp. CAN_A212]|uniref:hypothetical protein n=1 Tax=Arthrobacter sp. CAN_A212 TaxID=2787719 RepID=UPI0018CA66B6
MSELTAAALLILCLVLAVLRVPAALKGKNRATLAAFVLVSVVIALAIPGIYLPVDQALGGVNAANLISRLTLNVVFVLVGLRVADALACRPVRKAITGAWGRRVFAGTSLAIIAMFWYADVPVSSMGLNAYADQFWVEMYRLASRVYPAFIAVLLVPWTFRAALEKTALPVLRVASGLFATGFGLVSILPVILLVDMWIDVHLVVDVVVYTALAVVAIAPTITWASRRHYANKEKTLITATR